MTENSKVVKFGYLAYHSRAMMSLAINHGDLAPAECCAECGKSGRVQGHHTDYSKPLEVIWLCSSCHQQAHVPDRAKTFKRRATKLQKAVDWLRSHPDRVNVPSTWLEEELGMSYGTIVKAQRILRGQADIVFGQDGNVLHHSWEPNPEREWKRGRPRKKAS
jgi:hypothetical protein